MDNLSHMFWAEEIWQHTAGCILINFQLQWALEVTIGPFKEEEVGNIIEREYREGSWGTFLLDLGGCYIDIFPLW